jgi:hypothetical protein
MAWAAAPAPTSLPAVGPKYFKLAQLQRRAGAASLQSAAILTLLWEQPGVPG